MKPLAFSARSARVQQALGFQRETAFGELLQVAGERTTSSLVVTQSQLAHRAPVKGALCEVGRERSLGQAIEVGNGARAVGLRVQFGSQQPKLVASTGLFEWQMLE